MKVRLLLFLLVPSSIIISCVTQQDLATPRPTRQTAKISGKPYPVLKRGYEVYQVNCARCHEHRLPDTATLPAWHQKIHTMAKRANLAKEDEISLQSYLDEFTDR